MVNHYLIVNHYSNPLYPLYFIYVMCTWGFTSLRGLVHSPPAVDLQPYTEVSTQVSV